jgi:RND family efflux transporter MFP subunit
LARLSELHDSQVVSRQTVDDERYEAEAWEGRVAQLHAELSRLDDEMQRSTLRAPFDGVVTAERVQPGEWLEAGDPVVELVSLRDLQARLEVPDSHFAALSVGAVVQIRLDALPGVHLQGRLRALVPRANPTARTFPALVSLPPDDRLGVGMLVRAEISDAKSAHSILVPEDAVIRGGEPHVFVVAANSTVRRVAVEPLADAGPGARGEWVAVRGALELGDHVVVRGNEGLQDGQRVAATPLEMAQPRDSTPPRGAAHSPENATP